MSGKKVTLYIKNFSLYILCFSLCDFLACQVLFLFFKKIFWGVEIEIQKNSRYINLGYL